MKKKRRKYTQEFKEEAVKLIAEVSCIPFCAKRRRAVHQTARMLQGSP